MSEDVKPRKFEIFYSGLSGTFKVQNNYHAYIMLVQNTNGDEYPDDEYIQVIELEPTMRLMNELADALEFYSNKTKLDCGEMAFFKLEKYKKFKEALK